MHEPVHKWYKCDQCDFKTKTNGHLKRHKFSHTTETPHQCDQCPKAFRGPHNLRAHIKLMHEEHRQMKKCELCEYSTKQSYSLAIHFSAVHLGQKPFKCNISHKSYARQTHLIRHKKSHKVPEQDLHQCSKWATAVLFQRVCFCVGVWRILCRGNQSLTI